MAGIQEVKNYQTGEIISLPDDFSYETHEIRNKRKLEHQKRWRENGSNQFTFALQNNIRELLSVGTLNLTSLGAVLVLLPYLDTDGYLKYRTVKDKPFMNRNEIIKILRLSAATFDRVLRSLKDCGILEVEGIRNNQRFKINPYYHLRGKLPEGLDKVVRVQNRGIRSVFEEGNSDIKLDQLGFLYLLIPHLSYNNCRLVKIVNGSEDIDNALSITELAKKLGLSLKTIEKYLKFKVEYKFKDGLYRVPIALSFCAYGEKNRKSIIVNPTFFRRNKTVSGEILFSNLDIYFKNASKKINI